MRKTSLLCIGRDELLLETRLRVLSLRYLARGARNIEEMNDVIAEHFDLILFCHSLSDEQRDTAVVFARKNWPNAKLLGISEMDTEWRRGIFDAEVGAWEGPDALLRSVEQLLSSTPSCAERRDTARLEILSSTKDKQSEKGANRP